MPENDDQHDRVTDLIVALVHATADALSPEDYQERLDYCDRHDVHGVGIKVADEWVEFEWGGKPLAVLHSALVDVASDSHAARNGTLTIEIPDVVPDEWTGDDEPDAA